MCRLFGRCFITLRSHHVGMHPTRHADSPPALVVISAARGATPRTALPIDSTALLASLPAGRRVLWIDVAQADRARYAAAHPSASSETTSSEAVAGSVPPGPHDLIVLGRGLTAAPDPAALLDALAKEAAPGATLALPVDNRATLPMLQRWVEADLTDDDGVLAAPHLALGSWASTAKLLMDSGWMPTVVDSGAASPVATGLEHAALDFAAALGLPATTARRQWSTSRWIVQAQRSFEPAAAASGPACFTVVVPTTRDRQLRANVEHSPGLAEVDARIVSVRRAPNPATALAIAAPHVLTDWVLLAHQDIYFPRGFGERLQALLASIPADERARTLIGFAGMGVDRAREGFANAGFVIDRTSRADWGASDHAVSIDELALVLPREGVHQIDASLGWHLWATDLCLAAITTHRVFPRIVRMPIFHNSVTDHTLPEAFHASAARLAAKYPDWGPIHTLCGVISPIRPAASRSHAA